MRKRVGIVGEGPTDYLVLKSMIDQITGDENDYLRIQPEQNMAGEYGNGWKGVWNWCETTGKEIDRIMNGIVPKIDIVVIQMDGDVSRKEKEIHCVCESVSCDHREEEISPVRCSYAKKGECPVIIPCQSHANTPEGYREHISRCILQWTGISSERKEIILTVPCDSTDEWIMAAFELGEEMESIENPWENVMSRRKEYHGIRIPGHKKSTRVYQNLIPELERQWKQVVNLCESAKIFERSVKEAWND